MQSKKIEVWVGLFVVIALIAVVFLSLKVADIKEVGNQPTYRVYASFGNIGGLKERSPVKIGGVVIGRVASITLKEEMEGNYRPEVALDILNIYDHIPDSSEDLIGQFLYKTGDGDGKTTSDSKTQTEQPALP